MSRFTEILKSRRFIVSVVVFLVIVAAVTTTVVLTTRPNYQTLRRLAGNDIEQRRVSDYRQSRLWLHPNGTFSFKVVYRGNNEFVGIGFYQKQGNKYIFTYHDMYRMIGDLLQRDTGNFKSVYTYNISRNQIEVRCPNNRLYYFR